MKHKTGKKSAPNHSPLLEILFGSEDRRQRALTDDGRKALIAMLARELNKEAFDIQRLVPAGSFMQQIIRHFDQTDISYAIPLFNLMTIAASWLTQNGASLSILGVGRIRPTLWMIGLADSGSSKTFAAKRVWSILMSTTQAPVCRIPEPATDAQWIKDLKDCNGGYWFQDEVGSFVRNMTGSKHLTKLKHWMLLSYDHEAIANRIKSDEIKDEVEDPHFTFHGLSVLQTWARDVEINNMIDGWCQRINFYIARPRPDTTMFDHFTYFAGEQVESDEAELSLTWAALCAQQNASGDYSLAPETMDFLRDWWKSLEHVWGDYALPASFIRRIGFSVHRYMIVLQFLLGKSRRPIDIETAKLATTYAEFHLECALFLVQSYDATGVNRFRKIVDARTSLMAEGRDPKPRDIYRRLTKSARDGVTMEMLHAFEALVSQPAGKKAEHFDLWSGGEFPLTSEKIAATGAKMNDLFVRLKASEQKRNKRRLLELRRSYLASIESDSTPAVGSDLSGPFDARTAPLSSSVARPTAQSEQASSGVSGIRVIDFPQPRDFGIAAVGIDQARQGSAGKSARRYATTRSASSGG